MPLTVHNGQKVESLMISRESAEAFVANVQKGKEFANDVLHRIAAENGINNNVNHVIAPNPMQKGKFVRLGCINSLPSPFSIEAGGVLVDNVLFNVCVSLSEKGNQTITVYLPI